MPIININSISPDDPSKIITMLEQVRDAGATALKTTRDNVWVTFHPLSHYLNDSNAENPEKRPPYVTIMAQSGRTRAKRTAFVAAVVFEIAKGLSVPSKRVWVHFQEMNPADVWTGDRWVKE